MKSLIWRAIARVLSRPRVSSWIITMAQRTPYANLAAVGRGGRYMGRWWLFNPYDSDTHTQRYPWLPWSIRVHHIVQGDPGGYLHDHPWHARTIILKGGYLEQRLREQSDSEQAKLNMPLRFQTPEYIVRKQGTTSTLRPGNFHRIAEVSEGGAYTLFITGKWREEWGFLVKGAKVPAGQHLSCVGREIDQHRNNRGS